MAKQTVNKHAPPKPHEWKGRHSPAPKHKPGGMVPSAPKSGKLVTVPKEAGTGLNRKMKNSPGVDPEKGRSKIADRAGGPRRWKNPGLTGG